MRFDIFESYARDNHSKIMNNLSTYRFKDGLASMISILFSEQGLKVKQIEFPNAIKCSNSNDISVCFSDVDYDMSGIRDMDFDDIDKIFKSIFKKSKEYNGKNKFLNIKFLNIRDSLIFLNLFIEKSKIITKKPTLCPVRRVIRKAKEKNICKSYVNSITKNLDKYLTENKISYPMLVSKANSQGIEFLMRVLDTKLKLISTFHIKTHKKIYEKSKLFIVNSDNELLVESISNISVIRNTISNDKFYMLNLVNIGDFVVGRKEEILDKITFSESAINILDEGAEKSKSLALLNDYIINKFYGGSVKNRNVLIIGEKDFDEFVKDDGIIKFSEKSGNIKGAYMSHTLSVAESKIREINGNIKIYETEDLIIPKYVPEDDVDSNEIVLKGL